MFVMTTSVFAKSYFPSVHSPLILAMITKQFFRAQALWCFFLCLLVIPKAFGVGSRQVRVHDLFQVKSGTERGGFDDHVEKLQLWVLNSPLISMY